MEDFLDQHAVDSIKSRLESMIGKYQDPVGIDGSVIHFIGKVIWQGKLSFVGQLN